MCGRQLEAIGQATRHYECNLFYFTCDPYRAYLSGPRPNKKQRGVAVPRRPEESGQSTETRVRGQSCRPRRRSSRRSIYRPRLFNLPGRRGSTTGFADDPTGSSR